MTIIQRLGQLTLLFLQRLGAAGLLLFHLILIAFSVKNFKNVNLLIKQIYAEGCLSILIIIISALFIGMVVGLQGYNTLDRFGATDALGQLIALSVTRELGPVVSALLFAGRAGSALTAEIGLMKTTKQLASLEMMACDPVRWVIAPRFWGGIISLPLLTILFDLFAILGGYLVVVCWLNNDPGIFWANMQTYVNFRLDIFSGIIKAIVFASVITWIAVYQGFTTKQTAEGLGQSTTRTVVYSSLAVLGLDFVLTAMMMQGW